MIGIAFAGALAHTALAAYGESYLNSSLEYQNGSMGGSPYQTFVSSSARPVLFDFQKLPESSTPPGQLFLAPRGVSVNTPGPYIFEADGTLVWDGSELGQSMSFSPTAYKGKPVLALWQGEFNANGYGKGHGLLLNESYQVIANVSAQYEDAMMDFHEFTLTENGTALFTVYPVQSYDLSPYQTQMEDPTQGFIMSGVAQEVDVETGAVLWTWNSLDHVSPTECFTTPADTGGSADKPWDYFHINSIEKDSKGNYLLSSRHCSAIYYVSGADGSIIWQIGGQNSTFEMGTNTTFWYQHDARWHDNETSISLFDNTATGWDEKAEYARGMLLSLDMDAMKVDLKTEMAPFNRTPSPSQGSCERQPNGNWILGWGQIPYVSEHSPEGNLLWAVQFGVGDVQGYRAHRANWTGKPLTRPSLTLVPGNNTEVANLYMSWNGATEVKTWEVMGANSTVAQPHSLSNLSRDGFESEVTLLAPGIEVFFVRARHNDSSVLGVSNYVSKNGSDIGSGPSIDVVEQHPSDTTTSVATATQHASETTTSVATAAGEATTQHASESTASIATATGESAAPKAKVTDSHTIVLTLVAGALLVGVALGVHS